MLKEVLVWVVVGLVRRTLLRSLVLLRRVVIAKII